MSFDSGKPVEKENSLNISSGVVELLLENILQGKTAVLSTDLIDRIFRSNFPERSPNARNKRKDYDSLLTESPPYSAQQPKNINPRQKHAQGKGDASSNVNPEKGQTDGYASFDEEDCSIVDADESSTTRNVTPTGFVHREPVSEQFLHAKRILQQKDQQIPHFPDFSNLSPELEEAFTVSTAYLSQVITSSYDELYKKLELGFKQKSENVENTMTSMMEQLGESNRLCQSILEAQKAPQNGPVADAATNTKAIEAVKPKPFDFIGNFILHLQKTKMPADEINRHATQVVQLIGNDAVAYMARFGYSAKYKKK